MSIESRIIAKHPELTQEDAEMITDFVKQKILEVKRRDTITDDLQSFYELKCLLVADTIFLMGYDNYSENGLSAKVLENLVTKDLTPKAKVI